MQVRIFHGPTFSGSVVHHVEQHWQCGGAQGQPGIHPLAAAEHRLHREAPERRHVHLRGLSLGQQGPFLRPVFLDHRRDRDHCLFHFVRRRRMFNARHGHRCQQLLRGLSPHRHDRNNRLGKFAAAAAAEQVQVGSIVTIHRSITRSSTWT